MLWAVLGILIVIVLAGSPYALALRMAIDRQLSGEPSPDMRRAASRTAIRGGAADLADLDRLPDAEFHDRVAERLPRSWLFALLNSHYVNCACLLSACVALPIWISNPAAGRNLIATCVVSQLARWGMAIRSIRRETWSRAMSDGR
jgi:hypothetical protein